MRGGTRWDLSMTREKQVRGIKLREEVETRQFEQLLHLQEFDVLAVISHAAAEALLVDLRQILGIDRQADCPRDALNFEMAGSGPLFSAS